MNELKFKLMDDIADQASVFETRYEQAKTDEYAETYVSAAHHLVYIAHCLVEADVIINDLSSDIRSDNFALFSLNNSIASLVLKMPQEQVDNLIEMGFDGHTHQVSVAHLVDGKYRILPFQVLATPGTFDGSGSITMCQILPTDAAMPVLDFHIPQSESGPLELVFKQGIAFALTRI